MAKDLIHDAVKEALKNDGWTITHEQYSIRYKTLKLAVDLAAERTLAAERAGRKIAVEVKSFLSPSPVQDLKLAFGQYVIYLSVLEVTEPDRKLYLAVNHVVYQEFLSQEAIELIRRRFQVAVVVIDITRQEVIQWIE
ncbi:MAG: element excision factor XisH family protein [Caldilineaceae bacterium]